MPKKNTLQYCEKYLFSDIDIMEKDNVPAAIVNRIIRIRDVYTQWLQSPSKSDRDFVNYLKSNYNLSDSICYDDIHIIKFLLGNINKASKEFHRWKVNAMIERSYAIAENRKDARGMAAATANYIKANQLDKAEEVSIDWDVVYVQPFDITENPEVLGIKRIPNIDKKIAAMKERYLNADIQEVKYEEIDYNENISKK